MCELPTCEAVGYLDRIFQRPGVQTGSHGRRQVGKAYP